VREKHLGGLKNVVQRSISEVLKHLVQNRRWWTFKRIVQVECMLLRHHS